MTSGTNQINGIKFDAGKKDYTLLPWDSVDEVVDVLEYGKMKYTQQLEDGTVISGAENWKLVPDAKKRYIKAAFRHLIAYARGEKNDPETGLNHLGHAITCMLFIIWFDKKGNTNE